MGSRRGGAILASLAIVVGFADPAGAYAKEVNGCDDGSLHWSFSNQYVNWTATKKDWARAGINRLNDALDYDGTKLITVPEDGGVDVQLKDEPVNNYGNSECFLGDSIWVNSNYSTGQFYWQWARHEMFHLGGAEHGGRYDSFDGNDPTTMATCLSYTLWPTSNIFEQDGHAYENWIWSTVADRQLHANFGYEQGLRFWGKSAGSGSTNEYGTGGATGPGYIGWNSTSLNDYIYQTVRILNGDDTAEYRVKVNGESPAAVYTTRIRGRLYRRTADFPGDPSNPNGCDYADGIVNPNGSPTLGGWILMSDTSLTVVGTSWTAASGPWTSLSGFEAYDFQVRFYGLAEHNSTGGFGEVHLDNVRGEAR
jgi:hypothetical protein